jgi:hypothetical protein
VALVTTEELRVYMRRPSVVTESAQMAVRVAEGWLASATRLATWPDPVPEDLFAWAIELASLAYSNPEGLNAQAIGDHTANYAVARKAEILAAAARNYGTTRPLYRFPPPRAWP